LNKHLQGTWVKAKEGDMRIVTGLFFLTCLAGSAWAIQAQAPAQEMSAGIVGMTLAAGVVYMIKRRKGR
jgi:hypothetical protein